MEQAHPIPTRKPSVAALEKLASDAEETVNAGSTSEDNPPGDGMNLLNSPAFNTSNNLLETTIAALSRTPTRSPPISAHSLPDFSNSTPRDWSYMLTNGTQLDANAAEALYALSDLTWPDELLFSSPPPSDAFAWPPYNEEPGSSPMLTAPGSLDYCNIAPPNQLHDSSLSINTLNQTPAFGMLIPAAPVSVKSSKINSTTNQFSEISTASKWEVQYVEESGASQSGKVIQIPESPVSLNCVPTSVLYLPIFREPDFLSTDTASWDSIATDTASWDSIATDTASWDSISTDNDSSNITIANAATSLNGNVERQAEPILSLDEEVEQYVDETFRNFPEEVRESWLMFFKEVISKDTSSKSFWLSRENAVVWASIAEPRPEDSTKVDFADIDEILAEQASDWPVHTENCVNLNSMTISARDTEGFEMDLNDPILMLQCNQIMPFEGTK